MDDSDTEDEDVAVVVAAAAAALSASTAATTAWPHTRSSSARSRRPPLRNTTLYTRVLSSVAAHICILCFPFRGGTAARTEVAPIPTSAGVVGYAIVVSSPVVEDEDDEEGEKEAQQEKDEKYSFNLNPEKSAFSTSNSARNPNNLIKNLNMF